MELLGPENWSVGTVLKICGRKRLTDKGYEGQNRDDGG